MGGIDGLPNALSLDCLRGCRHVFAKIDRIIYEVAAKLGGRPFVRGGVLRALVDVETDGGRGCLRYLGRSRRGSGDHRRGDVSWGIDGPCRCDRDLAHRVRGRGLERLLRHRGS